MGYNRITLIATIALKCIAFCMHVWSVCRRRRLHRQTVIPIADAVAGSKAKIDQDKKWMKFLRTICVIYCSKRHLLEIATTLLFILTMFFNYPYFLKWSTKNRFCQTTHFRYYWTTRKNLLMHSYTLYSHKEIQGCCLRTSKRN